jgi:elongation factor G
LALERAFQYNGKDSEQIEIPGELQEREHEARNQMLEQLADHDDELLEQLVMEQTPDQERILKDLARETSESLAVPVLFGSAESGWGIGRLLKALRHETPGPQAAASRLEVGDPALHVFKISHGGTIGRLALARVLAGRIGEGSDLKTRSGETARLGALFRVQGDKTRKVAQAPDGDIVALAKVDNVKAGEWLSSGSAPPPLEIPYPPLNCALAIEPADRKDDVKLSGALHRLLEEDPALILEQDPETHEMRLRGPTTSICGRSWRG